MKNISNKLLLSVFVVLGISFLITLIYILQNEEITEIIPGLDSSFVIEDDLNLDNGNEDGDSEISNETLGIGAGGGGGGGDSSGGSNPNCIQTQISYSLTDFNPQSLCNIYQGANCIERSITCRTKIENFHSSVGGNFDLNFTIHQSENISNIFDRGVNSGFVDFLDSEFITLGKILSGADANFNISCSSLTIGVPYEEFCS